MSLRWNDRLSVHVPVLDEQHKEIVRRGARLVHAIQGGSGKREVGRLLAFLRVYVLTHFAAEEELMREVGDPGLELHAAQHRLLTERVRQLALGVRRHGPTPELAIQTTHLICGWLFDHIGEQDRALGALVLARRGRAA